MGEHHYSNLIVAAFAAFGGAFCAYLLTGYVMTENSWCISGNDHCVREWVAALSGWAAATAAGGTIFFLHRQLAEQTRQTNFLLGDAPPTMDVTFDLNDREVIVVRIVNWNRRSILLIPIEVDGLGDAVFGLFGSGPIEFDNRVRWLPGWESRNCPPASLQIRLIACKNGERIQWPTETLVRVGIHINDSRPQRITLESRLFPEITVFPKFNPSTH